MNMTGTEKQIDFATTIVSTINSKLAEMEAKLAKMDKGPVKNAMKDKISVLLAHSAAFAAIDDFQGGSVENAEAKIEALSYSSQAHMIDIVDALTMKHVVNGASDLVGKTIEAGDVIKKSKDVFYKLTNEWSV